MLAKRVVANRPAYLAANCPATTLLDTLASKLHG